MAFRNKIFTKEEIEQYKDSFAGADLSGANLTGLDLTEANLTDADLSGAYLSRSFLSRADLKKANLTDADLSRADLIGANLRDAILIRGNLTGAYLSGADLKRADLKEANLTQANLSGAYLKESYLNGANFTGANLILANLKEAKLNGANLTGANLKEANLTQASFTGANLKEANLTQANFTGANLLGANLTDADLSGANLTDAKLIGAILTGVISERIIGTPLYLPEGWKLIDGCLQEVYTRNNLMEKLKKFNTNNDRTHKTVPEVTQEVKQKVKQKVTQQSTCFDIGQQEDYNINKFLLGELDGDTTDEVEISRRLVFFVGSNQDNLKPFCYDLENLLADLNASIYTTDCTTYPRRLANPLFKLNFEYTVYVYLSDMIDVLTTTDKRVFVILPRLIPGLNDTQEEIEKTGSYNAFFVPDPNWVGADHCQDGTNKKVYNIYVCEGRDGEPCYPVEHV